MLNTDRFQSRDPILIGRRTGAHHLPVKKMVLCAIFSFGTLGRDCLFYSAWELDVNLFILKIIDMIRWKLKNLR